MKLDPEDVAGLRPLIDAAVRSTLAAIESNASKLDKARLSFSEAEAAELLGCERHNLRDCRRRGEIVGKKIGKRIYYSRSTLLAFLGER